MGEDTGGEWEEKNRERCSEGPQALAGWGYAGCLGRVILGCGGGYAGSCI
jgi:hypothetical protein